MQVQFSYPIPWWAWLLVFIGIVALAYGTYARLVVPLPRRRRAALVLLRALILLLLVVVLLRPVALVTSAEDRSAVVPIMVDSSRSMAIADAGAPRIDRAREIVESLRRELSDEYQLEVLTFGDEVEPLADRPFAAEARRTDLVAALKDVTNRYEGRTVAGIIVLSDGGDTGTFDVATSVDGQLAPVYAVGVGAPVLPRDRELLSLTAGEAPLAESVVDLSVSAVAHGFGTDPIELRVLANGRPVEVRRVNPTGDGSPVHEIFSVSPDRNSATLYTVEIPGTDDELVAGNNARSVLVSPPGRKRRVLLVEGAPGYEHSFLKRAWAQDPGFEVDSAVRKGKNDQGMSTFFVQADPARSKALVTGYPTTRETLFLYDAVVFANVEADLLTRAQLALTADFVGERGGGLLAFGTRTFDNRGIIGTPVEEVLPLEMTDRGGGILRATNVPDAAEPHKIALTDEGLSHPLMRIAMAPDENRRRWEALPALASASALGRPRPGAQVLAATPVPSGGVRPVVAVQRYGRGRAMLFAAEGAWRWRMMMPAADRSYETFWRQAARWLAAGAPDPVTIGAPASAGPGETVTLDLTVRDSAYAPLADADTVLRVAAPGGDVRELRPALADAASGRYTAAMTLDRPGAYKVTAEARRGGVVLGTPTQWFLVGGVDRELADPRLNEDVLRRVAAATGGRYTAADQAGQLRGFLREGRDRLNPPERHDIWHRPWVVALVVGMLGAEWGLRRRWGLR